MNIQCMAVFTFCTAHFKAINVIYTEHKAKLTQFIQWHKAYQVKNPVALLTERSFKQTSSLEIVKADLSSDYSEQVQTSQEETPSFLKCDLLRCE